MSDGQVAAFPMAVYSRMTREECTALTRAMAGRAGPRLGRGRAGGPGPRQTLDGGVGDTVSLILAPLVAASAASCR